MSTQVIMAPASSGWKGLVLVLLLSTGSTLAQASTRHRRSTNADRKPAHRAIHARSAHGKSAHKVREAKAVPGAMAPFRRPRWHPGVDLALRMTGQRVQRP